MRLIEREGEQHLRQLVAACRELIGDLAAGNELALFEMIDRAIGRHGYDVYIDGQKAGGVTSGTQTPFVKKAIGMAYLPTAHTAPGTEFEIDIRGRRMKAKVVPLPFYKRQK